MTDLTVQSSEDRREIVARRGREVGSALSGEARRLRLSTRGRGALYAAAGLRPRRSDRVFGWLGVLAFLLVLVAPVAAAVAYWGFIASDLYRSETRFTVSTAAPALPTGGLGDISIPDAKIVQDTQIVMDNIDSRAMLEQLEDRLPLRDMFRGEHIDPLSRLPDDAAIEEVEDYLEDKVNASVSLPGGIVTLTAQAFDPEDARAILREMLAISEELINDLNDRVWADVLVSTGTDLERAAADLQAIRIAQREERNDAQILDVDAEAEGQLDLLGTVQAELLNLESRFAANARSVSADAPQQRVLARQIEAKREQVDQLRTQIGGAADGVDADELGTLADASERAARLDFELELAEDSFADAVRTMERVRLLSSQQLMYLDPFLRPTLPEEARYPRRIVLISLALVAALVAFGVAYSLLQTLRRRFD